ncbi:DUF309 domain-containing protein [Halalkalibacter akibai]|uniref:DUF309 domain-containing protein n=1 Tax=Halalkalibacter akibai (strain ATCC 43226 / DSM 21942 / CIP 109018 / JCM 9157 / 1139) TaxID=1236973 RepID=W4QUJ3_HALA3|nr:DUF309 domain-containing protein [Halalkalibacter akibai]GAE35840.1 DUF309 domain-containing protein [Halalkalibacter akibai JCM 9157]
MYPTAYIDYLIHFHIERDYFECHEVLEEHWKKEELNQRHHYWVTFIQIAVGLYHHRRNNRAGATRMYYKALKGISLYATAIENLGVNVSELSQQLNKQIKLTLTPGSKFEDINLPLHDHNLIKECQNRCKQLGLNWAYISSSTVSQNIIHKHKLRNRQEVIAERDKQLHLRKQKRQ